MASQQSSVFQLQNQVFTRYSTQWRTPLSIGRYYSVSETALVFLSLSKLAQMSATEDEREFKYRKYSQIDRKIVIPVANLVFYVHKFFFLFNRIISSFIQHYNVAYRRHTSLKIFKHTGVLHVHFHNQSNISLKRLFNNLQNILNKSHFYSAITCFIFVCRPLRISE